MQLHMLPMQLLMLLKMPLQLPLVLLKKVLRTLKKKQANSFNLKKSS
jgi:hypothetical protein